MIALTPHGQKAATATLSFMPDSFDDSHAAVGHAPVLFSETLTLLAPALGPEKVFLDCTLGRGGHALAILPMIPGGTLIGCDLDAENLAFARARLEPAAALHHVRLITCHRSFVSAETALREAGVPGAHALLADLGFASTHVDNPARGFSFMQDGPLDMRLNTDQATTAAHLVSQLPENELADLIFQYGEERLSRRIAKTITEARRIEKITTTSQLAALIRKAYGGAAGASRIHPATRTFQALRIAVNGELDSLAALLEAVPRLLAPGGRAGIISFHSLEDRPVKQAFVAAKDAGWGDQITRKPVEASDSECAVNPRSRSAKLRVIEKKSK